MSKIGENQQNRAKKYFLVFWALLGHQILQLHQAGFSLDSPLSTAKPSHANQPSRVAFHVQHPLTENLLICIVLVRFTIIMHTISPDFPSLRGVFGFKECS